MDDKKIVKLDIKPSEELKEQTRQTVNNKYQTNPILKEMLIANVFNKKGKFNFKDLFRGL